MHILHCTKECTYILCTSCAHEFTPVKLLFWMFHITVILLWYGLGYTVKYTVCMLYTVHTSVCVRLCICVHVSACIMVPAVSIYCTFLVFNEGLSSSPKDISQIWLTMHYRCYCHNAACYYCTALWSRYHMMWFDASVYLLHYIYVAS